jgi:hypothetical protein
LVAIAINGATFMIGCHQGLFTWLQEKVPTLVNTHCVAYHEALVTSDALKVIPELLILDDFANKVYIWVGRSCKLRKELKSLMDSFDLLPLTILQFHQIHWLSQG